MATGGPCVGGSWVTFSSPLGTGEERKAHIYQGDQEKSPQKGLGAGPPLGAGPGRGRRSPHCGISRSSLEVWPIWTAEGGWCWQQRPPRPGPPAAPH